MLAATWRAVQPDGAIMVWSDLRSAPSLLRTLDSLHPRPVTRDRYVELDVLGHAKVALPTAPRVVAGAASSTLPANRAISRIAREVYRTLARAGLAQWLPTRCAYVIAAAPPTDDSAVALLTRWQPRRLYFSVHSGLPGATQKLNIRLFDEAGKLVAIAKVAAHVAADETISREIAALQYAATHAAIASRVPRLVDHGTIGARPFLVQSIVEGTPATAVGARLDPRVLELLRVLAQSTSEQMRFDEAAGVQAVYRRVARVIEAGAPPWPRLLARLQQRVRQTAPQLITTVLAHRDFTPWNLLLTADRANVVDWEFAQTQHVPLCDLVHYLVQYAVLVEKSDVRATVGACRDVLQHASTMAAIGRRPLSRREQQFALAFYLLDTVSFYQANYLVQRPPFWQVDWLEGVWFNMSMEVLSEAVDG
ncbi:MAG: phosphotransferase [Myxococcales bacterium]|nr:phosphotransferase [Myxococcales bacterium]